MLRTYIEYRDNRYFCHFYNGKEMTTPEVEVEPEHIHTLVEDLRAFKGKRTYTALHYVEDELVTSTYGENMEVVSIEAKDDGLILIAERSYRDGEIRNSVTRTKIRRLVIEVEND